MPDQAQVRAWMRQCTELFLTVVDSLDDGDFADATALPRWTRGHVVAHVHSNALALMRLLHWARSGERTAMYANSEQRAAEIDHGATLPPAELRTLARGSATELDAAIDAHPDDAWSAEVVTAQGRAVPATEVVWMRTREVAVHAVDLGTGVGFADLPDDLNAALLADVVAKRSAMGEAAVLAEWLTGRVVEAPLLEPWL